MAGLVYEKDKIEVLVDRMVKRTMRMDLQGI